MNPRDHLVRTLAAPVIAVVSVWFLISPSAGLFATPSVLAIVIWVSIGVLLGAATRRFEFAASIAVPAYVLLVGLLAVVWPMAVVVSETPLSSEQIRLSALLPNLAIVVVAWTLLYLYPNSASTAKSRLYNRYTLATGRLLLIAGLLTILFYALTVQTMEEVTLSNSSSWVELFYGEHPIYFLLILIAIWAGVMLLNLGYHVFSRHVDLSREATREAYVAAFTADRKMLGVIIAVLPLIGFLGTLLGISTSITGLETTLGGSTYDAAELQSMLKESLGGLSLAFESTIIGIGASAILLILASLIDKAISERLDTND